MLERREESGEVRYVKEKGVHYPNSPMSIVFPSAGQHC